jgi:hypothetical protein
MTLHKTKRGGRVAFSDLAGLKDFVLSHEYSARLGGTLM